MPRVGLECFIPGSGTVWFVSIRRYQHGYADLPQRIDTASPGWMFGKRIVEEGQHDDRDTQTRRLGDGTQDERISDAICPLVDGVEASASQDDAISLRKWAGFIGPPVVVPHRIAGLRFQRPCINEVQGI